MVQITNVQSLSTVIISLLRDGEFQSPMYNLLRDMQSLSMHSKRFDIQITNVQSLSTVIISLLRDGEFQSPMYNLLRDWGFETQIAMQCAIH